MTAHPTWTPCETCDCVDGRATYPRWSLEAGDEPLFPDGDEWSHTSYVCPARLVPPETFDWIALYLHYSQGFLLSAGGIADQPAKYLTAMSHVGSAVKRMQQNGDES